MNIDFRTLETDGSINIDDVKVNASINIRSDNAGYHVSVHFHSGTTVSLIIDRSDDFDYEVTTKSDQFYGTADSFLDILADSNASKYVEELIIVLKSHLRETM